MRNRTAGALARDLDCDGLLDVLLVGAGGVVLTALAEFSESTANKVEVPPLLAATS